jgi:hypothetical protein
LALPALPERFFAPGLDGARAQFRPRHQVAGGGEPGHVQADLGEDDLGAVSADAGDLIQAGQGIRAGCVRAGAGAGAGGAVGVDSLSGGDRRDQFPDPGGELGDPGAGEIDLVQEDPGQLGVVVLEPAGERLGQRGALGFHLAAGQPGEHLGVALPGDQRFEHVADR